MANTNLTHAIREEFEAYLALGLPVDDVCDELKIQRRNYYNWRRRGREVEAILEVDPEYLADDFEKLYVAFLHGTTRARAQAKVIAAGVINQAMLGRKKKGISTRTESVTKLRTITRRYQTDINGKREWVEETEEVPYEDRRITITTSEEDVLGDERVALEFLGRIDPEHWARTQKVQIGWRDKAIQQIRAGILTFEFLARKFDYAQAVAMYMDAGVDIPSHLLAPGDTVSGSAYPTGAPGEGDNPNG